jgi:hypothetical protein
VRPRPTPTPDVPTAGATAAAAVLAAAAALAAAAVALAACGRPPPPPPATADDLAAYLAGLAAGDPAAAAREVAGWPLDRALWERTLVEPYRGLWAEIAPQARLRALAAQLRQLRPGAVTARRHYAGDPRLTPGQLWQRWALPPLYPSFVAELDGRPLDAVFLHDGARWRALAGLDEQILARVRALDPACAAHLAAVAQSTDCASACWEAAEAALRSQRDRFARGCHLAATLCGKRAP